jgi:hypothetical protein
MPRAVYRAQAREIASRTRIAAVSARELAAADLLQPPLQVGAEASPFPIILFHWYGPTPVFVQIMDDHADRVHAQRPNGPCIQAQQVLMPAQGRTVAVRGNCATFLGISDSMDRAAKQFYWVDPFPSHLDSERMVLAIAVATRFHPTKRSLRNPQTSFDSLPGLAFWPGERTKRFAAAVRTRAAGA